MNTVVNQELDLETKARAEKTAQILSSVPEEKQTFFVAVANAYLDGLIAGQSLNNNEH